jgi:hypothetical protein
MDGQTSLTAEFSNVGSMRLQDGMQKVRIRKVYGLGLTSVPVSVLADAISTGERREPTSSEIAAHMSYSQVRLPS